MTEVKANDKITLSKEQYDELIRKSSAAGSTSIPKAELLKALEGKSIYAAAKALGKSYVAVKNAIAKYGIKYEPVARGSSGIKRQSKTFTLSEDEIPVVTAIVFALKNRPQLVDAIKAVADKCMAV